MSRFGSSAARSSSFAAISFALSSRTSEPSQMIRSFSSRSKTLGWIPISAMFAPFPLSLGIESIGGPRAILCCSPWAESGVAGSVVFERGRVGRDSAAVAREVRGERSEGLAKGVRAHPVVEEREGGEGARGVGKGMFGLGLEEVAQQAQRLGGPVEVAQGAG